VNYRRQDHGAFSFLAPFSNPHLKMAIDFRFGDSGLESGDLGFHKDPICVLLATFLTNLS
jgi:hypothetical protein